MSLFAAALISFGVTNCILHAAEGSSIQVSKKIDDLDACGE
jgi:hypothetical protein